MTSITRKFLAILLSVLMLLQALPMSALAGTVSSEDGGNASGSTYWNVTFVDESGETLVSQLVENNHTPVEPDVPDVEGKRFVGWTVNGGDEALPISSISITADSTLVATYRALNKYTVTIEYVYADGSTAFQSWVKEYIKGTNVSETVTSPTDETGNTTPDKAQVALNISEISADHTEKVTYSGKMVNYVVKHMLQNADDNEYTENTAASQTMSGYANSITEAAPKVYEGFTVQPFIQKTIAANGSTVVEINYNRNLYALTVNNEGGTYGGGKVVEGGMRRYGAKLGLEDNLVKTGYTFAGWKDEKGNVYNSTSTMPIGALTVTAQWTPNTQASYTVVYWLQSLTDKKDAKDAEKTYQYVSSYTATGTVGNAVSGINVKATNSGIASTFAKLNTANSDVNTSGVSSKTVAADGSTVINVKFDRELVTFKFYKSNWYNKYSELEHTRTGLYQQTWTQAGYSTDGWPSSGQGYWSTEDDSGIGNGSWTYLNGLYNSNLTKTEVKFYKTSSNNSKKIYQYTENLDGTWKQADVFEACSSSFTLTEKFQPGFSLYKYLKDSDDTNKWNDAVAKATIDKISNKLKVYNKRNSFELIFSNCTGVASATLKYEAPLKDAEVTSGIGRPANVEADFVFAGWYLDPAGNTPVDWNNATMPAAKLTVYAKWVAPQYTVTYNLNYDGAPNSGVHATETVVKYNAVKGLPEAPVRDAEGNLDYTFGGWYVDKGCTIPFQKDTAITSNKEVYAKWIPHGTVEYTVNYILGSDGQPIKDPDSEEAEIGTSVIMDSTTIPQIPGYIAVTQIVNEVITEDGQQIVIIYRALDRWQLTVRYVDDTAEEGSEDLLTPVTQTITAKQKVVIYQAIPDYKLVGDPIVVATADSNEVVFHYVPVADRGYTIEHYLENVDGSYTKKEDATETKQAKVGSTVFVDTGDVKSFEHYTFDATNSNNITAGTITANGNLVLKLYYKLVTFTVIYANGGYGTLEGEVDGQVVHQNQPYGVVTPAAPKVIADDDHYFTGWDKTIAATVTDDVTYTAQYAPKVTLTIAVNDKTVTYNGTAQSGYAIPTGELTASGDDYTITGLRTDDKVSVSYTPANGTDANTYTNGEFSEIKADD